ncbi:Uncharacterised protein [Weissella viridescens]|uniref:GTP cyclohydrolase I FolE n=1 Tax=Weissella viridescens TaxID=1629 RepID=A0A380P172_WEIVI|nr:Uncharacterised protein [Weissella viridescens]
MDHELIEASVRNIFKAIGEDPDRPGIQETPSASPICMKNL